MNLDKLFALGGAIVAVAMVTAFVTNANSASVIRSVGEAFSDSIRAALGK